MNKILIIGHGYVGAAISSVFSNKEKIIVDPKYYKVTIEDLKNQIFDVVFVCVDTPTEDNFQTLDLVLNQISSFLPKNTIVCCKSTAPPYFYKKAISKYKKIKIVYSPEFLSHYSNIKDFKQQKFLIFGGDINASKKINNILCKKLKYVKTT